jgi:hypothetical protein
VDVYLILNSERYGIIHPFASNIVYFQGIACNEEGMALLISAKIRNQVVQNSENNDI